MQAAASIDSSYQNAFLATTTVFNSVANTAGAAVTLTQAAQTNRAWLLKSLAISIDRTLTWVTSPNIQIKDGANILAQFDIPNVGSGGQVYVHTMPVGKSIIFPGDQDGYYGTPGNAMTIVTATPGNSARLYINAKFDAI
jgi:hypothetical protein